MELVSVQSSQISAIGHDGHSTLRVLFKRGGLYEYDDVSIHEYSDMRFAESIGSFFGKHIKATKRFRKIEPEEATDLVITDSFLREQRDEATPVVLENPITSALSIAIEADPKVQQVSRKSSELATQASSITVVDAASQKQASELLLTVAAMRKEIADTWKPMKEAAFKAHRTICAQETMLDAPLLEAEKLLKQRIGVFIAEQNRLAREEEERQRRELQEEADRKAREESERLAIDDAIALEQDGLPEEAAAVLEHPLPVAPVRVAPAPVAPAVASVKGISSRKVFKFRVIDEAKIPREYMVVNNSAIRAVVDRTWGKIQIPGIEVYSEQQVAASRGA